MIDFVAIDFETADPNNPCSLGIAQVENSEVTLVKQWLIKPACYPYFHFYSQKIHKITKEDVQFQPEFDKLWVEIAPFISNRTLVAHNAAFDISVLKKTLQYYKIPIPKFNYFCSYLTARLAWKDNQKYSLDFLCNQEKINLTHHRADSDAYGCAQIFLRELQILNISNLNELKKISKKVEREENLAKKERQLIRELKKEEKKGKKLTIQ
ncbi:MAG: 3'-5' exonuclease [Bacteroidales bacterium]|jgi:DNA polymerase-3 subunit epsilon|nr:3'-5' exonuclease [Bacteroidales bacterium]